MTYNPYTLIISFLSDVCKWFVKKEIFFEKVFNSEKINRLQSAGIFSGSVRRGIFIDRRRRRAEITS